MAKINQTYTCAILGALNLLVCNNAYSGGFCSNHPTSPWCAARNGGTTPVSALTLDQFKDKLGLNSGSLTFNTDGKNKIFMNLPLKGLQIQSLSSNGTTVPWQWGKIAYIPSVQSSGSSITIASVTYGTITGKEFIVLVKSGDASLGTIDSNFAQIVAQPPANVPTYTTTCANAPQVSEMTAAQMQQSGATLPATLEKALVAVFSQTQTPSDPGCTVQFPGTQFGISNMLNFY